VANAVTGESLRPDPLYSAGGVSAAFFLLLFVSLRADAQATQYDLLMPWTQSATLERLLSDLTIAASRRSSDDFFAIGVALSKECAPKATVLVYQIRP